MTAGKPAQLSERENKGLGEKDRERVVTFDRNFIWRSGLVMVMDFAVNEALGAVAVRFASDATRQYDVLSVGVRFPIQ